MLPLGVKGQVDLSKLGQSNGITRKNSRVGETSSVPKPDPNSERFAVRLEMPYDTTQFSIHMEDYRKGNKIFSQDELINFGRFLKGSKVNFEIVPDLSKRKHLNLFFYFQGMDVYRLKLADKGKIFKCEYYNEKKDFAFKEGKLLCIFYETDSDKESGNFSDKWTRQKRKLEDYLPDIDRCIIVYYKYK
ncbi:hypothetical protein D0T51_12285 [Parabacteroides sp. 52]|nr:hypothetical protein [Parabacteroides sp. 52]